MKSKKLILVLSLIALFIGIFSHINYIGLRAEEPRRAIVGIETYETGNLIVPQIHNETYYNKPPFYNWILALFYSIFQSFNEWVVRLPGILFFLLTGFFTYKIAALHLNKEVGILASFFYLTSADLLFYGTINAGEIDLFYSFIIILQAYYIFRFFHRKQYFQLFIISYILTFIGVMTKGIPSLAFQAITISAIVLYYKKWKLLFSWQHISGIFLFSILLGGYLYMYNKEGNLSGFLSQQFAESSDKSFNEGSISSIFRTIFKFPLQILTIMLPWSILLFGAISKKIRQYLKNEKIITFSVLFIISNIIIYWISPGVRNRYLYMFIPFLAIIAAKIFVYFRKKNFSIRGAYSYFPIIGIALGIIAIAIFPFFTNVSQHVQNKWLVTIIFIAFLCILLYFSIKKKEIAIYLFVFTLLIGRIWFNISVLPFLKWRSTPHIYAQHIDNINKITNKAELHWTGKPIISTPEIKLLGNQLLTAKFFIPPRIPYAIPYYQYKLTRKLMVYDSIPVPGTYYLGAVSLLPNINADTLYQFKDYWHDRKLILFKLH